MNRNDKITLTCPPNSPYANCVRTEVIIPEFSPLLQNGCYNVQEIEQDLYTLIGDIKDELDLTTLTSECQTLPTVKTVITLIQFLLDDRCILKTQIDDLIAQNVTQDAEILALQSSICP